MSILINDLVTHAGLEPSGRLIRISRIEPWPVVIGTDIVKDATSRCRGNMIVFDRLVPAPLALIEELRIASADEISRAARLGLLPPEVDDDSCGADDAGDRSPRNRRPSGGSGSVALPPADALEHP